MRKQTDKEQTSPHDRLGLNSHQFAQEPHKEVINPFTCKQEGAPDHIYLAADGAPWHYGGENTKLHEECGYLQLPWPPNSPDLNLIENVWMLLKRRLQKRFSEVSQRPHSAAELFAAARPEEEWAQIPQDVLDSF